MILRDYLIRARHRASFSGLAALFADPGGRVAAIRTAGGYWRDRRYLAKRLLYPGLDLHTRCRYRNLRRWIVGGPIETLDAGSGNGALSLIAARKGNRVLGVTLSERDVHETTSFFRHLGIGKEQAEFRRLNIYDLRSLKRSFDQIICAETLEHLSRDSEVVSMFSDLLRPGGRLILCCPNALHPAYALGLRDVPEDGGHVRDGYTRESFRELLALTELEPVDWMGLGSPLLCRLDNSLRRARGRFGDVLCIPAFLAMWPLTLLDRPDPPMPLSLAVLAMKGDAPRKAGRA